jgi:hypothetical protein
VALFKWLKKMFKQLLETLQFWKKTAEDINLEQGRGWKGEAPKRGVPKGRKYRVARTSRGGINMPKRQRCPVCSSSSKREDKTLGGANYRCSKHGNFFVRGAIR